MESHLLQLEHLLLGLSKCQLALLDLGLQVRLPQLSGPQFRRQVLHPTIHIFESRQQNADVCSHWLQKCYVADGLASLLVGVAPCTGMFRTTHHLTGDMHVLTTVLLPYSTCQRHWHQGRVPCPQHAWSICQCNIVASWGPMHIPQMKKGLEHVAASKEDLPECSDSPGPHAG